MTETMRAESAHTVDFYVRRYSLDKLLSAELIAALRLLHHAPGELLLRAGDPVKDLLFFVEGRAKCYAAVENGQNLLAAFYKPFDVLGDVELFSLKRYTHTVEALTETICLDLPVSAVMKAAEGNGRLFMYICGRLGTKLATRMAVTSVNLRYPVENRFASFLLAAIDGKGQVIGTDDLGEIADFLGASYRQLGRVVRRFRDEGIIDKGRGRIRVLDRKKLTPLAKELSV
jgi:CRP-like cAMP-binding protein